MSWEARNRTSARTWVAAIAALAALVAVAAGAALAASGGSGRSDAGALVKVEKTGLGRVLVDGRGRTLYLFEPDEFGLSVCDGRCAAFWPPLLTAGAPRAGVGAKAALLGTTKRKDGKLQVTYQGYPLYRFLKDTTAGQTTGQGVDAFGGEWYVLDAQGRKIEDGRHGGDPAAVKTHKTALGSVLTDARGRTLYLFEADHGTASACYGKCATFWPPLLTTGKPQASAGTKAALLGTTKRKDGALQVTYHGHPLYYFLNDQQAGQTTGEGVDGFGAAWYALNAAGTKIEAKHSPGQDNSSSTTTTGTTTEQSSGGYGGGYG
jgi:predicted lipoprotein with Yx(FWY)xxD motif